jgi:hypothetical protein
MLPGHPISAAAVVYAGTKERAAAIMKTRTMAAIRQYAATGASD